MKVIRWITPTLAVAQAEEGESLRELALAGIEERRKLAGRPQPVIWPDPNRRSQNDPPF